MFCRLGNKEDKEHRVKQRERLFIMGFNMLCFVAILLTVLPIYSSVSPFETQAEMFAACTFGMTNALSDQRMATTFISKLASYQNLSHSCVVKTHERNHFLRVKAKRNKKAKGFLHMTVYGLADDDESHLLGHLDVSKSESDWSTLILCPPVVDSRIQNRKLTFAGTPHLDFTVKMESSPLAIQIDKPKETEINQSNPINVFQFIPPEDISKTQLDVTVTSDSDVPAYLKVSRDCKDVKDNIRLVDYKGESIRLSFAKKGRITLSKVSIPPLTDSTSPWFIGITLKNASGKTEFDARKTVTLTLKRSFDYSYWPIYLLAVITFLTGIFVSICAFVCFKELFVARQLSAESCTARCCKDNLCLCCKGFWNYACEVIKDHWFTRGPKTFSYITAIVGFVLMVGASQFVFANWHVMIHEGDRDNCFYNDFCYRVSHWHDIPVNLMISNLTYILHGIILAVCVWFMEANVLCQCKEHGEELKEKMSFSVGYAFAWALFFEGCFSLIYHLCPSKMTFQFDTAFMFVIAGFTVILLYNGINQSEVNQSEVGVNCGGIVGAANFFLYFLVPLLIFNYFGALHHFQADHSEKGVSNAFTICFWIGMAIWLILILLWAGCKLSSKLCKEEGRCKDHWLCHFDRAFFCLNMILLIWIFISQKNNLPQAFLYSCIFEGAFAIAVKILVKVCYMTRKECCDDCLKKCFRVVYVIILVILWVLAGCFFINKPTTDKMESPEISRDLNEECEYEDFFDYHDMWHILSSHALLMGAYLVMFLSYDLPSQGETDNLVPLPSNA